MLKDPQTVFMGKPLQCPVSGSRSLKYNNGALLVGQETIDKSWEYRTLCLKKNITCKLECGLFRFFKCIYMLTEDLRVNNELIAVY